MFEKMKEKLPGMKGKEDMEAPKKKAMPGIEIEIEGEEEGMEGEESPEGMEDEEVAVGELAKLSDEELMAEVEKRGMVVSKPEGEGEEVASGGASTTPLPKPGEEEEVVVPSKKKKA